jgi:hypothetical protein
LDEPSELGMNDSANSAARAFWDGVDEIGLQARALPDHVRLALGRRFAQDAQMEHASIASFNRFSLQLLGVGAPADLVEQAQRAALDEVHHARICFAIAEQYLGQPLGPSPLDLSGDVLGALSLAGVVAATVTEGCVGETLAALEAEASRDLAPARALRCAWSIIAQDEATHAELAWSFVSWALEQSGAGVREAARRAFADAFKTELSSPAQSAISEPSLEAQGVLSAAKRRELRVRAVNETLRPAAASLCGDGSLNG